MAIVTGFMATAVNMEEVKEQARSSAELSRSPRLSPASRNILQGMC